MLFRSDVIVRAAHYHHGPDSRIRADGVLAVVSAADRVVGYEPRGEAVARAVLADPLFTQLGLKPEDTTRVAELCPTLFASGESDGSVGR